MSSSDGNTSIVPLSTSVSRMAGARTRRGILRRTSAWLTPVPVVCFTGALLTDFVYSRSAEMQWANFSAWLLLAGITVGCVAAAASVIDVVRRDEFRRSAVRAYAIGSAIVLILSLFNNFVHSRDSWTSVVPTGITLSALTVVAMLATIVLGEASARSMTAGELR